MNNQLDLFLDSRSVVLANEAIAALVARDAERASSSVARLRCEAPDDPHLPAFATLAHALGQWRKPARDTATIADTVSWLEDEIRPVATQVMGPAARAFLDAFFRELAEAACGFDYDPARPATHRAWLCLRCGDWAGAEEAALAIPRPHRCPDALHWLCVARHRSRGLAAARSSLYALAWLEPPRLASLLADLGDESLTQDWRAFERASEWESIEESELPAWFPAWYLLAHPGAGTELDDVVFPDCPPAQAARLARRLVELERQGNWKELTTQREQLRELSADLFALYMAHRSVRYL